MIELIIGLGLIFFGWTITKHIDWYKNYNKSFDKRFVTVAAGLWIYKGTEEDELSEDIKKLIGDVREAEELRKEVNIRVTIDLEEIQSYSEWTTFGFDDERIFANVTKVIFKGGETLVVYEPYDVFDKIVDTYRMMR